ncbi:MAG TPA: hypothetical protein VNI81_03560 [Candidatus Limnocylindrales bacterium]|jgi:hypothetical protein|nr:hypothetical protein [Candidatus Limnocylindrales bacterium]
MSNLSFARIMYGTSQEHHMSISGPVSNFPTVFQNPTPAGSQIAHHAGQGVTIESILHKVWMALSEKK